MAYQKKLSSVLRCPFEYALQIFGGKWKSRIICLLHNLGPLRFHRISGEMDNISDGVLSAALQELQTAGVVSRAVYAEVPPRVEYALTERGESLIPVLRSICLWAQTERDFSADSLLLPCQQCRYMRSGERAEEEKER